MKSGIEAARNEVSVLKEDSEFRIHNSELDAASDEEAMLS